MVSLQLMSLKTLIYYWPPQMKMTIQIVKKKLEWILFSVWKPVLCVQLVCVINSMLRKDRWTYPSDTGSIFIQYNVNCSSMICTIILGFETGSYRSITFRHTRILFWKSDKISLHTFCMASGVRISSPWMMTECCRNSGGKFAHNQL